MMTIPLGFLAIGAASSGFIFYDLFVGQHWQGFWGNSILVLPEHTAMAEAHHVPKIIKYMPLIVGISGVAIAYLAYMLMPSLPGILSHLFRPVYQLFYNKWYFDEIYAAAFVRPAVWSGRILWTYGDIRTIDAFGPDGISALVQRFSTFCSRLQTGYVFHYAFAMLIGVVALIALYARGIGG
jgi:NADH-quinone oxidoreductase subunit L